MKHEIVLETNYLKHLEFSKWYFELFFKATNVTISYHEFPLNSLFQQMKRDHLVRGHQFGDLMFFKFNNKLVALDSWSHCKYLEPMHTRGFFNNLDIDLYIKLDETEQVRKWLGYKTTSWVMFPGGKSFTNSFRWENKQHKYLSMFTTGRHSMRTMHRGAWYNFCKNNPRYYTIDHNRLPESEYGAVLKQCQFGLCVSHNGYKNTREYEFISNHMPFVLNYCPRYDFEFIPNKHFIYVTKPEDLAAIETIDLTHFAAASKQIWDDYYEPNAAVSYLDRLLNQ